MSKQKKPKPVFEEEIPPEPVVEEVIPEPIEFEDPEEFEEELDEDPEAEEAALEREAAEDAIPPVSEPVEEDLQGWKLITPDQYDGRQYFVTHHITEPPIKAFWRKTRVMQHSRWTTRGKWSDAMTRRDLLNEPIYYRNAN